MEIKEQLQRILEDVPKVYEAGKSSISQEVSNALKGNASGAVVALKDVSPLEHNLGVKVESKNLADIYGFSTEGIQNVNHGRFSSNAYGTTLSTTDAANSVEVIQTKSPNASNVTSYENGYFCIGIHNNLQDGDIVTVSFDVEITSNPLNATEGLVMSNGLNAERYELKNGRCSATLAWANYNDRKYIEIRNAGCSAIFSNFQVELDTTATPYTPYIADIESVKVLAQGANLFKFNTYWSDTCTYKDGVVTQTVVDTATYIRFAVKDGNYNHLAMSDFLTATGRFAIPFVCEKDVPNIYIVLSGSSKDTAMIFYGINLKAGSYVFSANLTNMTQGSVSWKDMQIERDSLSEYEPYKEPTEYAYGEEIKSIYPSTTLMTDTEGAVISVEYNRDINKAFAELQKAIISLGGNV